MKGQLPSIKCAQGLSSTSRDRAAKAKACERQGITQALSGSPASFTRGHKGVKPASYLSVRFFKHLKNSMLTHSKTLQMNPKSCGFMNVLAACAVLVSLKEKHVQRAGEAAMSREPERSALPTNHLTWKTQTFISCRIRMIFKLARGQSTTRLNPSIFETQHYFLRRTNISPVTWSVPS